MPVTIFDLLLLLLGGLSGMAFVIGFNVRV